MVVFSAIIVVGTTIIVITTIPTMIPRIIHIFFLRIIALLKATKSIFFYSLQMTYSFIETKCDAESALVDIQRDGYTKSIEFPWFLSWDLVLTP